MKQISQTHTPAWNKHPLWCWRLWAVVGFVFLLLIFCTESTCYFDEEQKFQGTHPHLESSQRENRAPPKRGSPGVFLWVGRRQLRPLPGAAPAGSAGEEHRVPWLHHLSPLGGLRSSSTPPVAPQSPQRGLSPPCSLSRLSLLPPRPLTFNNGPWQYPLGLSLWDLNETRTILLLQNIAEVFLLN